ncbi:MAG: hypothetical protein CMQ43_09430 [Gammaproteobacteria bacterium]|nr:hypothetical protein [Gammaproteobacteria bacterium]
MNDRQDQDLEALLGGIAPRREPPDDVRQRVFAEVDQVWRQRRRRRWRLPAALAASTLLAAVVALLVTAPGPGVTLEVAQGGGVWVDGLFEPAGSMVILDPGARVEARGGTRLMSPDGVEVRLRQGTRLTWLAPREFELGHGAVYVDTGGLSGMRVHTRMGIVRDIGTVFMVTLDETAMEVAIRDGLVAIETDRGDYRAGASGTEGDVVKVDAHRIVAERVPASSDRWSWIYEVHPGYRQASIDALLGAIAADLGLSLEFATPAAGARARERRLEGELAGLTPREALDVVLATTGLERRDGEPGRLVIALPSAAEPK